MTQNVTFMLLWLLQVKFERYILRFFLVLEKHTFSNYNK
jgi:hypothetical protein